MAKIPKKFVRHCPFCGGADIFTKAKRVTCNDCGAMAESLALWNKRRDKAAEMIRSLKQLITHMRNCRNCHRPKLGTCSDEIKMQCFSNKKYCNWVAPVTIAGRVNNAKARDSLNHIKVVREIYDKFELMQNCLNCSRFCNNESAKYCDSCQYYASNYGQKNKVNNWQMRVISIYESKLRRDQGLDADLFGCDI